MSKKIEPDDKKRIAAMLTAFGLNSTDFTGKVTLNINQGGITEIEKYEKIK